GSGVGVAVAGGAVAVAVGTGTSVVPAGRLHAAASTQSAAGAIPARMARGIIRMRSAFATAGHRLFAFSGDW
ncbi:MAG: hypothetical protein J4N73_11040, partial [Chloroflexi bacterium]|nr:hypothetical protein [Chloroflexota bacterium]